MQEEVRENNEVIETAVDTASMDQSWVVQSFTSIYIAIDYV